MSEISEVEIAKALYGLKGATREFFLIPMFKDGPRPSVPGLAADTSFQVARPLVRLGLAEKVNDRKGTNWFYLTPLGSAVRKYLETRHVD